MTEIQQAARRRQLGRIGAVLFAIAAFVLLLGLALPHQPQVDETGMLLVALASAALAAICGFGQARLPMWAYNVLTAVGTGIITLSLIFNGERHGAQSGQEELFYLWIAFGAAYFFTRVMTAVQVALVAVGFGIALLVIQPGDAALSRWLTVVALVAGAAIVVRLLSERIQTLLSEQRLVARTDYLTGLVNRRAFEESLIAELARVRRGGPAFSVIVADLDAFKDVNDHLGHATGDLVLTTTARVLEEQARTGDVIARLGGDEFALLLPGTDYDGACDLARRLTVGLCEHPAAPELRVGLSTGAAEYGDDGVTMDELLLSADRRLYEAKHLVSLERDARRRRSPSPRRTAAA